MSSFVQAKRYLAAVPAAGEGQRNDSLNRLAFALLERFDLSEADFEDLLLDWARTCSPPISDAEASKTIRSAWNGANAKGVVGSKASKPLPGRSARNGSTQHPTGSKNASPAPAQPVKQYRLDSAVELPEPIPDGTRQLLRTVFQPGEGIRIVNAKLNSDGEEIPDGAGPCLSREEWLRKLDVGNGDPNAIFSSTKKTGIYIGLNPLRVGGSKDSDVTAYRHALVEFDEGLSPEEQLNLYQQSRLPCAAVIYSGGKSVHAWVKVDARDRREYDERVKQLYQHFETSGYHLDIKNKNPSRLSRLPNCIRFSRRQELLALNVGCESFTEWVKAISSDDLPPSRKFSDFTGVNTRMDPNCVIGFRDGETLRFLCRGKSAWLLGPSGVGKSSLVSEFAIAWAMGEPVFGIAPCKPLKSLIVQAENDFYDLAEMVQGVCTSYNLNAFEKEGLYEKVDNNVLFNTETSHIQLEFIDRLHRLIDRDKPDIVWVDPLLSFAGIDVSKQDQCSMFLRTWLNPVLEATGVVLIGVHHTGKPKGVREMQTWSPIDYAYSGLGSSELVNWARAIMVLRPVTDTTFELKLAKRGPRAGARNLDGSPTTSIWIRHSVKGIRWEQIDAPEEAAGPPEDKSKHRSKTAEVAALNLHDVLAECTKEGESARSIGDRLHKWTRKKSKTLGLTTCRTQLLDLLVENKKLKFDEKTGLYFKGENA